jgi:hypothetical protein
MYIVPVDFRKTRRERIAVLTSEALEGWEGSIS